MKSFMRVCSIGKITIAAMLAAILATPSLAAISQSQGKPGLPPGAGAIAKNVAKSLVGPVANDVEIIFKGPQHDKFVGWTRGKRCTVSMGGWIENVLGKPGGAAVANAAKKQIESGTGSGIVAGGCIAVAIHELLHTRIGNTAGNASVDPHSCEHLAIDREAARSLCSAISAMLCADAFSELTDVDGVTVGDLFLAWCTEITVLNDKWEKGTGAKAKATACASGGMSGAFPAPPGAQAKAEAAGLDLPTPGELALSAENAVPDCECCHVMMDECCGI